MLIYPPEHQPGDLILFESPPVTTPEQVYNSVVVAGLVALVTDIASAAQVQEQTPYEIAHAQVFVENGVPVSIGTKVNRDTGETGIFCAWQEPIEPRVLFEAITIIPKEKRSFVDTNALNLLDQLKDLGLW